MNLPVGMSFMADIVRVQALRRELREPFWRGRTRRVP
jgi:hypothetical protein